jgi:gliding motility-associated-like protein
MKKTLITLIALIAGISVYAQVVINKYAAVLAYDPCKNTLTVDATTGFGVGDTVLLIQMKGATIDTTNTPAFGSALTYNGAGNYELNTIESIVGNVVTLHYNMARTYDIPNGKVQIVRVPFYQNYTINSPHTCDPWDGSKGGVFIINVANTLTMNDSIGVSSKGFLGAGTLSLGNNTCNETSYFYAGPTNKGANKAEGITIIGSDKMYGKGPLCNGGGGGNGHNAGGGGGGNGNAGGQGGDEFPNCGPVIPGTNGLGGLVLSYSNAVNKVFMGGGGGGGQTNEHTDKPGPSGGGLVFITAGTLVGNGKAVNANGGSAYECGGPIVGCANDGVCGGAAGGTVVLKVGSYTGSLLVNALGGKGADFWYIPPNTAIPYGTGGGGSGGVVWYSQAVAPAAVTSTLTGGMNGVCPQFANTAVNATPGGAGQVLNDLVFNFPTDTFSVTFNFSVTTTATACNTLQFTNTSTGVPPITSWHWNFGTGNSNLQNPAYTFPASGNYTVTLYAMDSLGCIDSFSQLVTVSSNLNYAILDTPLSCTTIALTANHLSGGTATQFTWIYGDASPNGTGSTTTHTYSQPGTYTVTLVASDGPCGDTVTQQVTISLDMSYTIADSAINCKTVKLTATHVSGDISSQFLWLFGDNTNATGNPVTHGYSQNGTYTALLVLTSSQGCTDTVSHTFTLPVDIHYVISDSAIDCRTASLMATHLSGDTAAQLLWLFAGGDTASGNPVVHTFPNTGANTADLVMVNAFGCRDTMTYNFTINYQLYADFSFSPVVPEKNMPTQFTNNSSPTAIKFYWDFGDSTNSSEKDPLKQYYRTGTFNVCLTVTDSNDCSATVCKPTRAEVAELIDIPDAFSPNGDGENDILYARGFGVRTMSLTIYNRWGQKIFAGTELSMGWDGTFKGAKQAADAYAYILDAVFVSGNTFHKQGNITILR